MVDVSAVVVVVIAVIVAAAVVVVIDVLLLMPVLLDPVAVLVLLLELLLVSELVESVMSVLELLVLDSLVVAEEIASVEESDLMVDTLDVSVLELEIGLEDALEPSIVFGVDAISGPWLVEEAAPESEGSFCICVDVAFGRTASVEVAVDMDEFCSIPTVDKSVFPVAESELPTVVIAPHFSSSLLGLYHSMACPFHEHVAVTSRLFSSTHKRRQVAPSSPSKIVHEVE